MEGDLWKVDGGDQEGLRGGVCRRSFMLGRMTQCRVEPGGRGQGGVAG